MKKKSSEKSVNFNHINENLFFLKLNLKTSTNLLQMLFCKYLPIKWVICKKEK